MKNRTLARIAATMITCSLLRLTVLFAADGNADSEASHLDRFGGFEDIEATATGWFHLQTINGRTVLVTPEGHPFVALGVNHIAAINKAGDGEADLFKAHYGGDWRRLREDVTKQFSGWGLNTVDNVPPQLREGFPYVASCTLAKTAKYFSSIDGNNPYDFPDIFNPDIQKRLQAKVQGFCRERRDDPLLIGYCWTDTPTWDLQKTRSFRHTDWVSEIRRLRADTPGKKRYVEFLRQHYEDIQAFTRAYGLEVDSFDLLHRESFREVHLDTYEVTRDDQQFLGIIARKYYDIVGTAMKKADPHHLMFGEKYLMGDYPDQVLEAVKSYIDVLSIQPGDGYIPIYVPGDMYPKQEIERLHKLTGKPVFICDHQISFGTKQYPVATWPFHQRTDEAEAAAATERFICEAFEQPYVIGYMRCQYIDRYSNRRGGIKLGFLRDDGTPYRLLVEHTAAANKSVIRTVRQQLRGTR
jgi:hypothetical protein